MKILAISGSLRAQSSNTILLEAAAQFAPVGVSVELYTGIGSLPFFSPDLLDDNLPMSVKEFRALLANSDGVLISSPEYAHGIPGVLKNALDWLVSDIDFVGKRVALINSSASAAEHLTAQLLEVLTTMSAKVVFSTSLRAADVRRSLVNGAMDSDSEVASSLRAGFKSLIAE